jgi:hypothetical protein
MPIMTRKRFILSAVGLLVVLLVFPVLGLQYFNWNHYRDRVATWVGAAIEREVLISDRLDFQLWPTTKLSVSGLQISSPEGVSDLPLLNLQSGEVEFAIWPLLSGILVIDRLELDSPAINLVSSLEEGATNWRFRLDETVDGQSFAKPPLMVRELQVRRARIQYSDSDPQLDLDLQLTQLEWVLPEDVRDSTVTATGTLNGSPLQLKGSLMLVGDDDFETSLDLALGAVTGSVSGTVSDLMEGGKTDLSLSLETEDLTQSIDMFVPERTECGGHLFSGTAQVAAVMRGQLFGDSRLDDIDVTTRSEHLRITASGSISSLGDFFKGSAQGSAVSPTRLNVLAETQELGSLVQDCKGIVPFKASAEAQGVLAGSLRDFRIDDVVINASGEHGKLSATGYMDDLLSPQGWSIDFRARSSTDQPRQFVKSYTQWDLPLTGEGVAIGRISGPRGDVSVSEIELELASGSMTLKADGEIGPMGPQAQFNMPFKITNITTDDLAKLAHPYGYAVPAGLQGQVDAVLIGNRRDLRLRDIDLELASHSVTLKADGTIGPIGPETQFNMPLTIDARNLAALAQPLGLTVPEGFTGQAQARLVGERKDLNVSEIKLAVASDIVTISAGGTIGPLGKSAVFNMPISVESGDLMALAGAFGFDLPLGGQVTMSAAVGGSIGGLDLNGVSANLANPFGRLALNGRVASLGPDAELDLDVDASVPDLAALEPVLGWSLDQYPGVSLVGGANLLRTEGRARLSNVNGVIKAEGIRSGRFSGQLPDLSRLASGSIASRLSSGSIAVDLELDDLGHFTRPLGLTASNAVPATLSAKVVGSTQPESPLFVVFKGNTDAMHLQANGQVNISGEQTTFDLNSRFDTDDVAKINQIFGATIPLEGSLSVETIFRRDASQDAKTINGIVRASSKDINAAAQGTLSWPLRSGNQLRLQFESRSLANLSRWLPGNYLDPGPLRLESQFTIDEHHAPLGQFSATLGNNDLSSKDIRIQGINLDKFWEFAAIPGEKVRIEGDFESSRLNFLEIFPPRKKSPGVAETRGSLFSNEPLSVDWIKNVDLDIHLQADDLVSRGFKANGLSTDIGVADGVLDISARSGEFSGGTFSMDIGLDTRTAPYDTDFRFDINGLVVDQVPALYDVQLPLQGTVDVVIDLSGTGVSPKEIVSSASGSLLARGVNTAIPASGFDFLTNSILVQIFSAINPKKKSEFHRLDCGVIGLRIVDGIVMSRDSVALQTQDVTYLIRGGFSLKDESVVFLINPKARKGFGVSAANLTNFYRIGGNLLKPKIEADPGGVLKTGATWGLAAATAGLSILAQGLFDKFTGDQDVCLSADKNQEQLLAAKPGSVPKAWKRLQTTPNVSNGETR